MRCKRLELLKTETAPSVTEVKFKNKSPFILVSVDEMRYEITPYSYKRALGGDEVDELQ